MQAIVIKESKGWKPIKLEITFETEREYEVFKNILQTNTSVPRAVCEFNKKCSFGEVADIMGKIYSAFRG